VNVTTANRPRSISILFYYPNSTLSIDPNLHPRLQIG